MTRSAAQLAAVALLMISGCGGEEREKAPIPLGKVPAGVIKAAQKELKDVVFDAASSETVRGVEAFELRGKDKKGQAREVKVSRDGKILGNP